SERPGLSKDGVRDSLSLRERAGVRGNDSCASPALLTRAGSERLLWGMLLFIFSLLLGASTPAAEPTRKLLYVAEPGIRNDLQYGGHGVLVFDIERDYQFVKRIPSAGLDEKGAPLNVKGVCASAATGRLYVSTLRPLHC